VPTFLRFRGELRAGGDPSGCDGVGGDTGLGFVDVYTVNGTLARHLVARGPLNEPWGLVIAPKGFGPFAGDLLVGNLGNGRINAFSPSAGRFLGPLDNAKRHPISISGLWGLMAGNSATSPAGSTGTTGASTNFASALATAQGLTGTSPTASTLPLTTSGVSTAGSSNPQVQAMVNEADSLVGKPYVYGAAGPGSYDCSGLTMASWRQGGISLPHNAAAQYGYGTHIAESALQPGDLIRQLNGHSPASVAELKALLDAPAGSGWVLVVQRGGQTITAQFRL